MPSTRKEGAVTNSHENWATERYSSFFRVFADVFIRFMFHLSAITYSNDFRVHKNYSTNYVINLPSAHAFGNFSSFLRCL